MKSLAKKSNPPARAWQRMLSGRRLDLLDPSPFDIEIEDIAHGLARVARWNGQTQGENAFSVAMHSIIVEQIFTHLYPQSRPEHRLMALLHDGAEYVVGDMISPFKTALGIDYQALEQRIEMAIFVRFGLDAMPPMAVKKGIKRADKYSAYFEARQIAGFSAREAERYFTRPPAHLKIDIHPCTAVEAQKVYLQKFQTLLGMCAP